MTYKTNLLREGLIVVTAFSLGLAVSARLGAMKYANIANQHQEAVQLETQKSADTVTQCRKTVEQLTQKSADTVTQCRKTVEQLTQNALLVTPETLADYEFHPSLNNSYFHFPNFSQESSALSKIDFDAKQPSSLERVLRNIVSVGELNSTEPVSLDDLWQKKKRPPIYSFDLGQGLMVSDQGHMLTAAHVIVDDRDKFQDWNPFVIVTQDKKVHEIERILAISEKYDLALVKTSYRPQKFIPPSFSTSPKPKGTYTLVGVKTSGSLRVYLNDSGSMVLIESGKLKFTDYYSQGVFESADASLQRYDGTKQFFTDMFIMDQHSQPGFSGSVAADKHGKIIGFVSGSRNGNQAIVAKSARVKELLEKYLEKIKPKN